MKREHPLKKFYEVIDRGDINYKINNIPDFPSIIEFEVTNHCNFHCLMCKTGVGTSIRKRGFMDSETYNVIISELEDKECAIKFVGQGEPLLNPNFIDFAKMAKEKNLVCHLTTNASLMNEEIMQQLIDIKFDSIKFSFQGINKEGFKLLRQKDYFDELMDKIELLYRKRDNNEYPFITICTSVTNESEEDIIKFIDKVQSICDKVEVGKTTLEYIELDKICDEKTREEIKKLQEMQSLNKVRYKCCNQVFDVITVRWNGDVSSCCGDNDGIMTLGNVHDNKINECWNSEKQNFYRNILKDNRYEELELCKHCYDFMGYMQEDNKHS
jgi:radical SAM protein with 4Fe4S-binding SPASM domain